MARIAEPLSLMTRRGAKRHSYAYAVPSPKNQSCSLSKLERTIPPPRDACGSAWERSRPIGQVNRKSETTGLLLIRTQPQPNILLSGPVRNVGSHSRDQKIERIRKRSRESNCAHGPLSTEVVTGSKRA